MVSLGTFAALEDRSLLPASAVSDYFDTTGDGLTDSASLLSTQCATNMNNGQLGTDNDKHGLLGRQPINQDILTCGVCLRDFSLSDIIKFIDHKVINGCRYYPVEKFNTDDCCSCVELDLNTDVEEEAQTNETNEVSRVGGVGGEGPDAITTTKTLVNGQLSNKTDNEDVVMDGEECTPPKPPQSAMIDSDDTSETILTNGDNKENENVQLTNGKESSVENVQQTKIKVEDTSDNDEDVVDDDDGTEVSITTNGHLDNKTDTEKSINGSESRVHNHLCRYYRRVCKHYQRALLNRLFYANNRTGETLIQYIVSSVTKQAFYSHTQRLHHLLGLKCSKKLILETNTDTSQMQITFKLNNAIHFEIEIYSNIFVDYWIFCLFKNSPVQFKWLMSFWIFEFFLYFLKKISLLCIRFIFEVV